MKIFKLPDLGEGLPDAIIREWYVKESDTVTQDQPLVAMETAKALVDVPSPFEGEIEKLFGAEGDTIETGQPLIGFVGEAEEEEIKTDTGTVVGAISTSDTVIQESAVGVSTQKAASSRTKATPAVRALAKKLGVNLNSIQAKGARITSVEVRAAASKLEPAADMAPGFEKLSPIRCAMVLSMSQSSEQVVAASIFDDVNIHAWEGKQDITMRIIRGIQNAVKAVPILNAHLNAEQMAYRKFAEINLGIAVDTAHGLYVPVLKDIANQSNEKLREKIDQFKEQANDKAIAQQDLHGATIMMSNFGTYAGRYATPVILPPMVAIIGVGRMRKDVVAVAEGFESRRVMPLSITFDHRLVTGGEAAQFLKALIDELSKPSYC